MLCNVSGPFEKIFELLSTRFANVHKELLNTAGGRTAVFLGESYFFRTGSDAAVMMILKENSQGQNSLEIISCAGGTGFLQISWGTHDSFVNEVKDILVNSGFKVGVVEEIPNYHAP
jgi:hypothetical protein